MKFGDTLRQRSIPAWQNQNIDYEDIKLFIKDNTTPGKGKPLSVPGSGDEVGKDFEDALFHLLHEQHERITWFVRSKTGEIKRRLAHLERQVDNLGSRRSKRPDGQITVKTLERYARLENDVLKLGEEIKSLSRFARSNHTAFHKLLKKYKRWTGSTELGHRFETEVLAQPTSFTRVDLAPIVSQYEQLLDSLRATYHQSTQSSDPVPGQPNSTSPADEQPNVDRTLTNITRTLQCGTRLDFDQDLDSLAIGAGGRNACYWVHPDNVIELQVLLLQHLRTFDVARSRNSISSSTPHSPLLRDQPSSPSGRVSLGDLDAFDIVCDDADHYLTEQNSKTLQASESEPTTTLQRAAIHARGVDNDDHARLNFHVADAKLMAATDLHVKKQHVQSLLTGVNSVPVDKVTTASISFADARSSAVRSIEHLRKWLSENSSIRPLATVASRRSRFYNQSSNSHALLLASLDNKVKIVEGATALDGTNGSASEQTGRTIDFPHSVLRIRQEGQGEHSLIDILDKSHLVERVRGFSLEYHAVWTICQPEGISSPPWLPLLDQDIRKVPRSQPTIRDVRTDDAFSGSQSTTPQGTGSTVSTGGIDTSPTAESSGRNTNQLQVPPLQSFGKKRKELYSPQPSKQQYWSEYDHPEYSDGEDDYVLYINPHEESPLDSLWTWIRSLLARPDSLAQRRSLLGPRDLESASSETDDEMGTPDSPVAPYTYGTIAYDASNRGATTSNTPETRVVGFWLPQSAVICLCSSLVITIVALILAVTGRRKLASEVDAGIVFAVASSLTFAVAALVSMIRHKRDIRWFAWLVAGIVLIIIPILSGSLLARMFA